MGGNLKRWLRELRAKKGSYLKALLIGAAVWIVHGSLEHRFFTIFNDWQDAHLGVVMEWLKPIILWFVTTPIVWPILVVCGILAHSYWRSRDHEIGGEESIESGDPRLSVAVKIIEEGLFSGAPGIVITNVGGSEVQKLTVQNIKIAGHQVEFDSNIPTLKSGDSTHPLVPIIAEVGTLFRHDLIRLMLEEWGNQTGGIETKLLFSATAEYEDFKGKRYAAAWDFELYPFKKWAHQNLGKSIDTTGPYLTVSSVKNQKIRVTKKP